MTGQAAGAGGRDTRAPRAARVRPGRSLAAGRAASVGALPGPAALPRPLRLPRRQLGMVGQGERRARTACRHSARLACPRHVPALGQESATPRCLCLPCHPGEAGVPLPGRPLSERQCSEGDVWQPSRGHQHHPTASPPGAANRRAQPPGSAAPCQSASLGGSQSETTTPSRSRPAAARAALVTGGQAASGRGSRGARGLAGRREGPRGWGLC